MRALLRYRITMSRAWWPWLLVAMALGCLAALQATAGWVSGAAGVGCTLSLVALWLVVTIRRDRVVDEVVDLAGGGSPNSELGEVHADGLENSEVDGDH